jgi:alkyl sulfatase BDS1-like metallo-beta-lactamase superfamily hydrolase
LEGKISVIAENILPFFTAMCSFNSNQWSTISIWKLFLVSWIELRNETLTNIEGFQAPDADLTITINRADLEQTMMGAKALTAVYIAKTCGTT